MDADRVRWDERYADHGPASATAPEALDGRDDLVALIPFAGRALDLACGTGGQVLWLAARGLDVVALDVSPRAIELTREAGAAERLSGRIDARVHDFDSGTPDDLGTFDVVLCQRFRDRSLYRFIVDSLHVGGIGIVTVLSAGGGPGEAGAFHAAPGELGAAFTTPRTEPLLDEEAGGVASIVFRRR